MSKKEGDSVSGLLNIFREEGYNKDISLRIGVITSVSPFKVKINEAFQFDRDDVTLSRAFRNQLDNNIIHTMSYSNVRDGKIEHEPVKIGEQVIGILDGDEYYIIDRV